MGRVRNNRRKTSKSKEYKKAFKTDNRARDVDQIQEDIEKEVASGKKMNQSFTADDDLPGLGQHYCTQCGRHFSDEASLTSHAKSRGHVRR
jgi:5-methylcytosine-specific restriction endonuclease McrA